MPFYKKLLILIILAIFFYILYSLLSNRIGLIEKEGFVQTGIDASKIKDDTRVNTMGIQSINKEIANRPLKEYIIKSSYNTAVTGKLVNIKMIEDVLRQGCRFLDFEVFYNGSHPFVSYSTDTTFRTLATDSSFALTTALNTIMSSAFNSDSPNPGDPLFIQLRVKSSNTDIYQSIAKSINETLLSKLYTEKINEKTTLNDIMKKVVLVMDKTINRGYAKYTDCSGDETDCYDLKRYINIESGSEFMRLARYSDVLERKADPPDINDDNETSTVKNIKVVMPDVNQNVVDNPELSPFILKTGCQIVLYRFYNKDSALEDYNDFFKHFKSAFVPLSRAIPYLQKKRDGAEA